MVLFKYLIYLSLSLDVESNMHALCFASFKCVNLFVFFPFFGVGGIGS